MTTQCQAGEGIRLTRVLDGLGIAPSSWYVPRPAAAERRKPGPAPREVAAAVTGWVVAMATTNPWYGYKRIAVMCRKAGQPVSNRQAYRVMKAHRLLLKRKKTKAELLQARKLWELLPAGPNELWQMDVTYIFIPGFGWWYAVTVIDYFSRYLLTCHLTMSYEAGAVCTALDLAREEAERLHGPLAKPPFVVTDNGTSFISRRFRHHTDGRYGHVRIQYRTPTQLGLLERFHRTLKEEEVYWRIYERPSHCRTCLAEFRERYNERRPHWALVPIAGGDPCTPAEVYRAGHAIQIPRWQGWAREARKRLDDMMEVEVRCG